MEALVSILLRSFSAHAVNTSSLAVVDGRLADSLDGGAQVVVERTRDWTSDVVSEIPGSDKEDVDTGDLGDLFDLFCWLDLADQTLTEERRTYILKRLLGLNLDDGEQGIIRLLQVFELGDSASRAHGERAAESSTTDGRELGRLDESAGVVLGVKQRNHDAVSTGIQGP